MNIRTIYLMVAAVCYFSVTGVVADVPNFINFQGALADSIGNPISDTRQMEFALYAEESGGIALWIESHPSVEIIDGLFRVQLGSVNVLPASLCDGSVLWLGITISPDGSELMPRQPLVTVPYGFKSAESDHAVEADLAQHATQADTAQWALGFEAITRVDTADYACWADSAYHALFASHASNAVQAEHATEADNGYWALLADSAGQADQADSADIAGYAMTAGSADQATYADTAAWALDFETITHVDTADYA
jgi:hypothetical protein